MAVAGLVWHRWYGYGYLFRFRGEEYGVWSMEYGVWSMEYGVECRVAGS